MNAKGARCARRSGRPEAVELYEEHWREIQVVVTDYKLPGMTGEAVLDNLQRIDPAARAIVMTGYYGECVANALFAKGPHGYLERPFHLEELAENVSRRWRLPDRAAAIGR